MQLLLPHFWAFRIWQRDLSPMSVGSQEESSLAMIGRREKEQKRIIWMIPMSRKKDVNAKLSMGTPYAASNLHYFMI